MKIVKFINLYHKFLHLINFDKHRNFRQELLKLNKSKAQDLYDYGEGMFYQSISIIKLYGLRNSKKRIKKIKLNNYLLNKTVLDIGTNIGAIPISSAKNFKECIGIDHNPDVIEIANKVKDYLQIKDLRFICADFLKLRFQQKFELILSLANHSTFDKGINDTNKYFEKIYDLLSDNGILILESHSPLYENPNSYMEIVNNLKRNYKIIDSGKYDFGNYYDRNRIFHIMKKI